MAEITAALVRSLRDKTDLPMMDCKSALVEADGDMDKAMVVLRERGKKVGEKRKDNPTSEGRFRIAIAPDGKSAALVELQCESAPVSKAEDFVFLAEQCAQQALNGPGAATPEELLAQTAPGRPGMKLSDLLEEVTNKIREKIVLARVMKISGTVVGGYVHHDGKLAVLFEVEGKEGGSELLRDVAMHIASMRPTVTLPSELPAADVAAENARLTEETKASGKPENIIPKIVEGRMKLFYEQKGVLVEQKFVKDDTKTVGAVLAAAGYKPLRFTRLVLGN